MTIAPGLAQPPTNGTLDNDPNRDRLVQPRPTDLDPNLPSPVLNNTDSIRRFPDEPEFPEEVLPPTTSPQPSTPNFELSPEEQELFDEEVLREPDSEVQTQLQDQCDNPVEISNVLQVVIEGSTVYTNAELFALDPTITNKLAQGQSITLGDLCNLAKAITLQYVEVDRYFTSQAIVPPQEITDGTIRIQVIEGTLEGIQINGLERLRQGYIEDRVRLGVSQPLQYQDLEDQLQLLKADPLFESLTASIRALEEDAIGQSILRVEATESDLLDGRLSYDNYSAESVGTNRFEASLTFQNLSGIGDSLTTAWRQTGELGSRVHRFTYQAPINAEGGTVQLETNISRSQIVSQPFDIFDIEDRSEQYEVSVRQPLWRSPREEFALSFGYSYRTAQTSVFDIGTPFGFGPESDGSTRLSVVRFSQDYLRRDRRGAWAVQSQINWGNGWFGSTTNSGDLPDSRFLSWLGQLQRYQRLNSKHLLVARLDLQLSADPLLSAEQFVIGGGQSVRGYRQNARSGDRGLRLSLEDRITLRRNEAGSPLVQLIPFWDMGYVWNHGDNPNSQDDERWLSSVGVGAQWNPVSDFTVHVDYGLALNPISDNGNDLLQGHGLHFSFDYEF